MKRCSMSHVIRERQTKTVRHHHTAIRKAKCEPGNSKRWPGRGVTGALTAGGNAKRYSHFWRWQPTPVFLPGESTDRGAWQATVRGFAESDMPEVTWHEHTATLEDSFSVNYKTERNHWMLMVALVTTDTKTWKQPRCASEGEGTNELWSIQTTEYYSTTGERGDAIRPQKGFPWWPRG